MNTQELIRETQRCIYTSFDIDKSMFTLFTYLKNYFPLDLISAVVFDAESKTLRYIGLATESGGYLIILSQKLSVESRRYLSSIRNRVSVFNTSKGMPVINELAELYNRNPNFNLSENFSTLISHLKEEGSLMGGIVLVASGENRFNEEHERLIKVLANPLSKAITNLFRFKNIISVHEQSAFKPQDSDKGATQLPTARVVGAGSGLKNVMDLVKQVAPLSSPVLITGETGVGKEIIAQTIHNLSERSNKPLVIVNCGAIPETLIDSELFGYVKGAFTGADTDKKGYFEQADKGTIFLDEIGELSLHAQVKLLRILQNMEFQRVGSSTTMSVDVRVIAATNRDLHKRVRSKRFRDDLWYRLHVFPIHIPPLRERRQDIPLLAEYFAIRKAKAMNFNPTPKFRPSSFKQLVHYEWPGNVRELQNVIERAIIICKNRPLSFEHVFMSTSCTPSNGDLNINSVDEFPTLDDAIRAHIKKSLLLSKGKIEGEGGAAKLLNVNPSTLRSKMKKLSIE